MARTINTIEEITASKGTFDGGNKIIGPFEMYNSKINFEGDRNILISRSDKGPAKLVNAILSFKGNDSVVFLGESGSDASYQIDLQVYHDNYCYIGTHTRFNGYAKVIDIVCAETGNLFIGDDSGIANAVRFQLSDIHPVFNISEHKRINYSKSTFIGDHVWIGPDAKILKGAKIGSGAIIGMNAIVSGKKVPSNSMWGGVPARSLKEGIFYLFDATNVYTQEDTLRRSKHEDNCYIYAQDETTIDFDTLEKIILSKKTAEERAQFFVEFNKKTEMQKNKFYIPRETDQKIADKR